MKATARPTAARGGRPAKFAEPSRPVTLTLPDRILDRLAELDEDRARAVVKAVDALPGGGARGPFAELRVDAGDALLVVPRSRLLAAVPWLTLVEIAPGRNLISLRDGIPVEKLEVTLGDLLESNPDAPEAERRVLRDLLERIRTPRRNHAVRTEQILVVRGSGGGRP